MTTTHPTSGPPFWIVGNWKMHGIAAEWRTLLHKIAEKIPEVENKSVRFLVCPPHAGLFIAGQVIKNSGYTKIALGAQDIATAPHGAMTGDTSVLMVADAGCTYSILGHSERRTFYKEDCGSVGKKAHLCLKHGITPIVCIGEKLEDYEKNTTISVLGEQISHCLEGVTHGEIYPIVAYEPVWAIGTGKIPQISELRSVFRFLRQSLMDKYGEMGYDIPLLYGGSVTQDNAAEIASVEDINGFLIGGASLDPESFIAIAQEAGRAKQAAAPVLRQEQTREDTDPTGAV